MEHIDLPYSALITKTKKEFKQHEERRYKSSDRSGAKRKAKINSLRERDLEDASTN